MVDKFMMACIMFDMLNTESNETNNNVNMSKTRHNVTDCKSLKTLHHRVHNIDKNMYSSYKKQTKAKASRKK
jgi:hypothetical protein